MHSESIHRYCIPKSRATAFACLNNTGSEVQSIRDLWASMLDFVVFNGGTAPKQWLSAIYSPRIPLPSKIATSSLTSWGWGHGSVSRYWDLQYNVCAVCRIIVPSLGSFVPVPATRKRRVGEVLSEEFWSTVLVMEEDQKITTARESHVGLQHRQEADIYQQNLPKKSWCT